ncbi:MAG: hypothetical protein JSR34_02935 [Proteobacteria bacterium]|nr:hypothetical protein [Pseudomonadota bacterium]
MTCLEIAADIAQVVTGILAVYAAGAIWWRITSKRCKLERYLCAEKAKKKDKGQRTVLHLMAALEMTEDEVIRASFGSKKIKLLTVADDATGLASALLLEYVDPN